MVNLSVIVAASDSGGSFLVSPDVGLMIWTLVVFGLSMFLLGKLAFPRIAEALDRRQKAIEESIDAAEHTRSEADEDPLASTASGSPRRAARPTTSSPVPARPARRRRTRSSPRRDPSARR